MSFYLEHDIGIKGREKGRDSWKKSGAETRLMAYSLRVQRTVYVRTYLRFVRSFSFFSVTYLFAFSPVFWRSLRSTASLEALDVSKRIASHRYEYIKRSDKMS